MLWSSEGQDSAHHAARHDGISLAEDGVWRSPESLSALMPNTRLYWPSVSLLDTGWMAIDDLPQVNAVTTQIEVFQGSLARGVDGTLGNICRGA